MLLSMTYTITYKTSSGRIENMECSYANLKDILQRLETTEAYSSYSVEDLNTKTDLCSSIPALKQDYHKLKTRSEL